MSTLGLALVGVSLGACGQRGPLYLPTDPAAKDRATLPSLLLPGGGSNTAGPGGSGAAAEGAGAKPAPTSTTTAMPVPPQQATPSTNDSTAATGNSK